MFDSQELPTSPVSQWLNPKEEGPIMKFPLQFTFPPVQALSKELTKLNSAHQYRIVYLGPRWDNSTTFHKKYSQTAAYDFNSQRVNKNNTFLQNSMSHNQFYKNEIYYRAFEGMNPTLDLEQQLVFESRFEAGNLDCAVKVAPQEYDLFLRIDSNTRGHLSWFYFSIKNGRKEKVKLTICNLTKSNHFAKGLTPYVYSSTSKQWLPSSFPTTFAQSKLRYDFLYEKINMPKLFQLSFEVQFNSEAEMKFAYCIPYTYSDLATDIQQIRSVVKVGSLGSTLTGISIPVVVVGEGSKKKKVILITGRIHPGESNSSLMISAMMKKLCDCSEMSNLREKYITVFVPMLNPDGVILGNTRCGALGKDLNRQFKSNNQTLIPEIVLLKNLISKITETHSIDLYLDFHGHSCRKNMFMFGPNYSLSQPLYYKCRVLPKLLSSITPIFRYYGCNYDIPPEKKATARAVMISEMMIPLVYTVQTSLGFYYDRNSQKTIVFDGEKWSQMGELILTSLKQYYEGMEQLEVYMESKRKARKEGAKSGSANGSYLKISQKSKRIEGPKQEKDIKMLQIFQQIKKLEENKESTKNKKEESDSDSDSHDSKQQLQKEKQYELAQMVSEYFEAQSKSKANTEDKTSVKHRKLIFARRKQQKQKAEEDLFIEFESEFKSKLKKEKQLIQFKNKSMQKNAKSKARRVQVLSHELKKYSPIKEGANVFEKTLTRFKKHSESQGNIMEQKLTKLNVRMFNFNKVILESSKPSYSNFENSLEMNKQTYQDQLFPTKNQVTRLHTIKFPMKGDPVSEHPPLTSSLQEDTEALLLDQSSTSECKQREKNKFPPSFYKIRYQNVKKKQKLQNKQKSQSTYLEMNLGVEEKKEDQKQTGFPLTKIKKFILPHKRGDNSRHDEESQSHQKGSFAQINQFPLL